MVIKINNLDFKYVSEMLIGRASGISSLRSEMILQDINLHIKKGDFIGIIGPNASGKTTLLKNISKFLKPSNGAVLIDNRSEYKIKELAKKLAVVSDELSAELNFTAFETVLMGRFPHLKMFEREKKYDIDIAKKSMVLTNTTHLADKPIKDLSSGEKQRILIAQALTQEPRILLLDEPTSHLDINQRIEIFDLIHSLNKKEQITVITVLHDLNLASQYCDRLVLLNMGRIFAVGSVREVLTSENIEKVYGIMVNVKEDLLSGKLIVHPVRKRIVQPNKCRIHIIGGYGNAISLMNELMDNGYTLSLGVISTGDSDYISARALDIELVEDMPFSPITKEHYEKNIELIKLAEYVILANIPVGVGNLSNLESLRHAKNLIIIEKEPIEKRDYTNGTATKIYNEIKANAIVVKEPYDVLGVLK